MTLRRQLLIYLLVLQVVPLALAIHFFRQGELLWFFGMEVVVFTSILLGALLLRKAMQPVRFVQAGRAALQDRAYGSRLRPVGVGELDEVVKLFNELLQELHEEQLKLGEQKGFFDKLLQATPIGIVIHDFDGNISSINPAAETMLALRQADVKGSTLANCETALARAIVSQYNTLPALLTMPDGLRVRVQQSMFYDRGFQRRFLMLEELTSEMQAAERNAYEKLIQMTSHEVNNTIGATNSLLQGCQEYAAQLRDADRDDFTRALQVVTERNSRLAQFMQRLAQVVHLPAPDCQLVDLGLLVRNIGAMFAIELRKRNITWRVVEDVAAEVNLDTNLFEQVLINIVKNAYEAIGKDGTITVSIRQMEGRVELVVEDSAGSLPDADRHKSYKPFHSTKRDGQGIGLMLVREILRQHGFTWTLACKPGQWTRFCIQL